MLGLPDGPPEHVTGVTLDSRRVRPGDLYAALPGFTTHGARFAAQAQSAGAAGILTDPSGADLIVADGGIDVPLLVVDDPRGMLGAVSAAVYGEPARALVTTGITGTNGKTTVSYLLDAALRAGGHTTGVIGTVATHIGDEVLPATRTTPEAPDLHALLAVMRERGASAVTMEVSSHALELGRVDGVHFDLAVFTNLSQDHLDFHGDMESYFRAKAQLFTAQRAAHGLVCVDDQWGQRLATGAGVPVTTCALDHPADWTVRDLRPDPAAPGAVQFTAVGPGGLEVAAGVGLAGRFNVANALAALAAAVHHGVAPQRAADAIRGCPGVPGRMERVSAGQDFVAIVDYAHTPDAVARAIGATREAVTGRVITVLGCGGDRDREKRPSMGEVAARDSDILVITDDNPRSESARAIREAIVGGTLRVDRRRRAQVLVEADRARAIGIAAGMAQPGDAVLVLGKGHEQGQEAAGMVTPFDDRVELRRVMEAVT
jgi:UDP-N-acetylmuramoyl-L-alanyl-D-glutamate--2,6-diaminopimelate ligase